MCFFCYSRVIVSKRLFVFSQEHCSLDLLNMIAHLTKYVLQDMRYNFLGHFFIRLLLTLLFIALEVSFKHCIFNIFSEGLIIFQPLESECFCSQSSLADYINTVNVFFNVPVTQCFCCVNKKNSDKFSQPEQLEVKNNPIFQWVK